MIDNINEQNDIVEDFAKQLDEICAKTDDLNESGDEDVPYGYEQLPEDDDEGNMGGTVVDSDSDEINQGVDDLTLKDGEILCNSTTPKYELAMDDSNAVCNKEANIPDVAPLMISLDPKESIPEETSTLIMNIMKKCQLPEHAIPDWAKSIPESRWMPTMDNSNSSN